MCNCFRQINYFSNLSPGMTLLKVFNISINKQTTYDKGKYQKQKNES